MRILALETSGMAGSVAVLEGARLLAEKRLAPGERSAKHLAPAIAAALAEAGWAAAEVELVAVAVGPGSFTGLRVGVTTAKTLAYANRSSVLGVNTLEVIAWAVPPEHAQFHAVIDAQRAQSFVAEFVRDSSGRPKAVADARIVDDRELLASLATGMVITGPGLTKLAATLPAGVIAVPEELWSPMASAVGAIAHEDFQSGRRDDVFRLVPEYFRAAAAEEQWNRKSAAPSPSGRGQG